MEIEHLADHVEAAPILAAWMKNEWAYLLSPDATPENIASQFREHMTTRHQIPQTFVAVENGQVVGTASIVRYDMDTRKDLSPWLAAVYVAAEFRGQGVGSRLVLAIMEEAKALGVERLFLFTPDRMNFYSRLGWRTLEQTEYCGKNVTIMAVEVKWVCDESIHGTREGCPS